MWKTGVRLHMAVRESHVACLLYGQEQEVLTRRGWERLKQTFCHLEFCLETRTEGGRNGVGRHTQERNIFNRLRLVLVGCQSGRTLLLDILITQPYDPRT